MTAAAAEVPAAKAPEEAGTVASGHPLRRHVGRRDPDRGRRRRCHHHGMRPAIRRHDDVVPRLRHAPTRGVLGFGLQLAALPGAVRPRFLRLRSAGPTIAARGTGRGHTDNGGGRRLRDRGRCVEAARQLGRQVAEAERRCGRRCCARSLALDRRRLGLGRTIAAGPKAGGNPGHSSRGGKDESGMHTGGPPSKRGTGHCWNCPIKRDELAARELFQRGANRVRLFDEGS